MRWPVPHYCSDLVHLVWSLGSQTPRRTPRETQFARRFFVLWFRGNAGREYHGALSPTEEQVHGTGNSEVVQRCEGLRLHHAGGGGRRVRTVLSNRRPGHTES